MKWRGGWRSVLIECGGQCVTDSGIAVMPLWFVDSLDSLQWVSVCHVVITSDLLNMLFASQCHPCVSCYIIPKQVHGHFEVDKCLARELAPSTFKMLVAMVLSPV